MVEVSISDGEGKTNYQNSIDVISEEEIIPQRKVTNVSNTTVVLQNLKRPDSKSLKPAID